VILKCKSLDFRFAIVFLCCMREKKIEAMVCYMNGVPHSYMKQPIRSSVHVE
jgi:hypothetical protein